LAAHPHIDTYWRKIADRMNAMVVLAVQHLRIGTEEGQVLMNLSLPAKAGHNLVLAARFALFAVPSATAKQGNPSP
jgi:hypothetical protein